MIESLPELDLIVTRGLVRTDQINFFDFDELSKLQHQFMLGASTEGILVYVEVGARTQKLMM